MNRRVERSYIDSFVERLGPNGLLEYAKKANVSASTISKARLGIVPKRQYTRERMAKPLRISEEQLFPILPDGEEQAS